MGEAPERRRQALLERSHPLDTAGTLSPIELVEKDEEAG